MIFKDKYDFLSNYFVYPIEYKGIKYTCVQSAFQAQKDISRSKEFSQLTGKQADKLGKTVNMRPDWNKVKIGIMYDILITKFKSPALRNKLNQVTETIIFDNDSDSFWGKVDGRGRNHLGRLLMQIKE